MHYQNVELWQHHHAFSDEKKAIEKRTAIVVIITFVMMIAEILFGWLSNSMALLADGWHMGTHTFALGISLFSYIFARKYSNDGRFTFGTWRVEILGAYTSSIVLGIVGCFMIFTSVERFFHPLNIHYNEAILVAIIGLFVNFVCASILKIQGRTHEPHHIEEHDHSHSHHLDDDLNFQSAYLHVIADALTSVLAIVALLGAKYLQYNWLDPFMGIVGAVLILQWSFYLVRDTARILLQRDVNSQLIQKIKTQIESDGDTKICDLHVWKVAQNRYACIVSLVTGRNQTIEDYKERLNSINELAHVTVEINVCVR
jgi:cation diffusion facilitator family transporter